MEMHDIACHMSPQDLFLLQAAFGNLVKCISTGQKSVESRQVAPSVVERTQPPIERGMRLKLSGTHVEVTLADGRMPLLQLQLGGTTACFERSFAGVVIFQYLVIFLRWPHPLRK